MIDIGNGNKSLEFIKKRILSGKCNEIGNDDNKLMREIDFIEVADKIKFNEFVKVLENSWETELCFGENKITKISVTHNPNAKFDYFSSKSCCCDGTLIFFVDLCEQIFNDILTGKSCYIPKKTKDVEEYPYNYDVSFEVGNFVFEEEYGKQFATKDKKWMRSRFTVMLPIKCDFIEKWKK